MTDSKLRRLRDPAQLAWLMIDVASADIEARDPTPSPQGKDQPLRPHDAVGLKGGVAGRTQV
jgi:hypothetical protein